MKKWIILTLQTIVSLSLLAWIFRKPDFRAHVWDVFTTADPVWLLTGLAAAGVMNLLGVVRWGIFLRVMEIDLPAWDILRISWVGLFFNSVLVGAVGGDAVKVIWLCAKGYGKYPSLVSVLLDRVSGLGALIICSATFILLRLDWLTTSPLVAGLVKFIFIYLACLVAFILLTMVMAMDIVTKRMPVTFPGRARYLEFTAAYRKFLSCWKQSLLGSALSFVILIIYFFSFYCAARAFDVNLPVLDFFSVLPIVDIISALPVSLGGFGVRESLFSTLLHDLGGIEQAQAVSASLCGAFLSLVWGLAGLALLPSYRRAAGNRTEA